MARVTIEQLQGTTFVAKGESNHWVVMDGTAKTGGTEAASRPMELVLFALGGCTAMDVEVILKKMKVPLRKLRIEIDAQRADEHPKVYTRIDITYHFYGPDLPMAKLERAVSLSQKTYCSVSAMLRHSAEINVRIENHQVN